MQNYYQQLQQQQQQLLQQKQQQQLQQQQHNSQTQTRRRTRSSQPDQMIVLNNNSIGNNNNNNNISSMIRQYTQGQTQQQPQNTLSLLQRQPSPYSDIESSRIQNKQPSLTSLLTNKPPTQQRKSNWSRKQRIKYFVFLNYYSQLPHWGSDLKSIPTYKSLSVFIKTRSPQQCKSYHLSMRRNYKSIDEMLVSLREELKEQEGFVRLVDKYQVDILAFEIEYKLLESYGRQQKSYFQQKLVQRSKRTTIQPTHLGNVGGGIQNINNNNVNKTIIDNNNNKQQRQKQQQQQQQQQQQCNFKINIKDIMMMGQNQNNNNNNNNNNINNNNQIKQKQKQKKVQLPNNNANNNSQLTNNYNNNNNTINLGHGFGSINISNIANTMQNPPTGYPTINYFHHHMPHQLNQFVATASTTINNNINNNNRLTNNNNGGENFIFQHMMGKVNSNTNAKENNKQIIKGGQNNNNNNNNNNIPSSLKENTNQNAAERLYMQQQQQNYNRFLQANKNIYNPYQPQQQGTYNPYQPNPFLPPNAMNPMQFNQQFRPQLPFSIPPPGGIPYMLHGFSDPYGMGPYNSMAGNRFGPSLVPTTTYPQPNKPLPTTITENQPDQKTNQIHLAQLQQQQQSSSIRYSQRRKKLLLQCHKNWINWLRAVNELNKRKQLIQNQQQQQQQQNIATIVNN